MTGRTPSGRTEEPVARLRTSAKTAWGGDDGRVVCGPGLVVEEGRGRPPLRSLCGKEGGVCIEDHVGVKDGEPVRGSA